MPFVRFLESVFNNTSIDLNSILAAVLIGILALVTIGPNFLGGGSSSYGYNRNGYEYDYQDAGYGYGYQNQNEFYKRNGFFGKCQRNRDPDSCRNNLRLKITQPFPTFTVKLKVPPSVFTV